MDLSGKRILVVGGAGFVGFVYWAIYHNGLGRKTGQGVIERD